MPGKRGLTTAERFWSKVQSGGPGDCWPWTACDDGVGYGVFRLNGRNKRAPRVAYELTHGTINPTLNVCHRCDNPPCCNPAHLFLGTHQDNADDKNQKGRGNQGERHGHSRLTDADVLAIRAKHDQGAKGRDLAKEYRVATSAISKIVNRLAWKHI